jgi:hypothetical protein
MLQVEEGEMCTVSGWGYTSEEALFPSDQLRKVFIHPSVELSLVQFLHSVVCQKCSHHCRPCLTAVPSSSLVVQVQSLLLVYI